VVVAEMRGSERGVLEFWRSAVHGLRFPGSGRCLFPIELRRPRGGCERGERGGGGGRGAEDEEEEGKEEMSR
jgi:hypothetical protein